MPTLLRHTYTPRGACKEVMGRRDAEVLLAGPAGTGKSRACLEKLNRCALRYPGMRGLMLRKTQQSLTQSALVTWKEKVIPEALRAGIVRYYGGSQQTAAGYLYDNGSVVNVGGMDNPLKIMSTEYDVIYVQEAVELSLNDWESATSRLRNAVMPYQQLIADTNPSASHHWLKRRADEGTTVMLHSRHTDNPVYFRSDDSLTEQGRTYLARLDSLTGVRYKRLKLGLWVSAEGQVYEDYDEAIHVIEPFEVPSEWPRWWTVDFGHTNPFVCQHWAEDPDGRLFMYREVYHTKRIVEDHARQLLRLVTDDAGNWTEPKPQRIICDHDAEDRATLERHLGLATTAASKTVTTGIESVQGRLRTAADGRPRLFLVRNCTVERDPLLRDAGRPTSTQEEFETYVWNTRDGRPPKEEPVKEDDHGMDALRYLVTHRDRQGSYRIRWL